MAAAPVPMPMVMVPVMSPANLLGLQLRDLGLRRDGGMKFPLRRRQALIRAERTRRQRRGLCARGQRNGTGGSGGKSNGELQEVATFHDLSFRIGRVMREEFGCAEMNGR
jgi:hypothetical protein